MPINLMQTSIAPQASASLTAALADTQGNILKSHGRDHSEHLFVRFTGDPAACGGWLAMMADTHVTTALEQFEASLARAEAAAVVEGILDPRAKARAITILPDGGAFVNLALSAAGYRALGLADRMPDDPSFLLGSKDASILAKLRDPAVEEWEAGYQGELHALVLVADDDAENLAATVAAIEASLAGTDSAGTPIGEVAHRETGVAMRLDDDGRPLASAPVREHFGFVDGISQPLFFASDIAEARRRNGGIDGYDSSAPLALVLIKDPGGGPDGHGSYFAYRKLRQDVAAFKDGRRRVAEAIALEAGREEATPADEELAGAYMVGRFRDGTPVVVQDVPGWTTLPNNFTYDGDADGVRCPLHAHIRKVNPRGDTRAQLGIPLGGSQARRIARRGVSFGPQTLDPAPEDEVGLLFLSAQASIVDQFEFTQVSWSGFPDFLRPGVGLDPLISQPPPGTEPAPQAWPRDYGSHDQIVFEDEGNVVISPYLQDISVGPLVTVRGAEYFFAPSPSFLRSAGSAEAG
ncbi:Dyp-type peroxidase [Allostreptomyces psammosilenae]|uniref:Deferrochelatase/peroxidase EfeB n=1 Tax=Allostreptomyces psammosilenae TaxID=1892865 RepID=A0A852ZTW5_9ACTN|nr:hypothetical protein [Allostreptomyces psammosilenae]NYI04204.1 deferrochelatase/peroxidase EfeB [Allostreptomyces psammosilenae]